MESHKILYQTHEINAKNHIQTNQQTKRNKIKQKTNSGLHIDIMKQKKPKDLAEFVLSWSSYAF